MTWSLAYESSPITATNEETSPMVVFWDYFHKTFLPSKGWTVVASAYSSSYTYYLCKKSFVQENGLEMRWCFNNRFSWSSSLIVTQFVMPWTTTTADIAGYIHLENVTGTNWYGMHPATREGQHMQIWESDVYTDAFFVKTRETSLLQGDFMFVHFPDIWHSCDPALGIEDNTDADVSTCPVWFGSTGNFRYKSYSNNWVTTSCYFTKPDYFTSRMNDNVYLTNKIVARQGIINVLRGTADDMLFRTPWQNIVGSTNWQAIGYQGNNYVDVGYTTTEGLMFNVGQVDPQTGV